MTNRELKQITERACAELAHDPLPVALHRALRDHEVCGDPLVGVAHDQTVEDLTLAQRQLATYARTGDLKAVVDQLIAETAEGL